MTIANDIPTRPYAHPKTPINNNNDPILRIAEYPTDVDSSACIFALRINEMVVGIRERDKI